MGESLAEKVERLESRVAELESLVSRVDDGYISHVPVGPSDGVSNG